MTIDEYNENLKAMDRIRAYRKPQPKGLAKHLALKMEKENAMLAPFSIEKDFYGEYMVRKGAAVYGSHKRKKDAVDWILMEKARA